MDDLYKYFYENGTKLYIASNKTLYNLLEKVTIKDAISNIIEFYKPDLKKLKIDVKQIINSSKYADLMTTRNLLYTDDTKYFCKLVLMHVMIYFMNFDKEILLTDTFRESDIINDDVIYFYHTASKYCITGYKLTKKLFI
jgi:hypothetical protein